MTVKRGSRMIYKPADVFALATIGLLSIVFIPLCVLGVIGIHVVDWFVGVMENKGKW